MNFTGGSHLEEKVELQMTPMIDCVFLLLIFFIATLKFPEVEGNLPAYLPKGKPTTTTDQRIDKIVIRLDPEGNNVMVTVNNATVGRIPALNTKLFLLRRQIPGADVTIDAAPDVRYRWVVEALNSCAKFGFRKVSFAQPREEGV